ncbi:MFS transporter [Marinitenerispora sediminis]|uniref:MFS transporter n=1 Tax=Marinitenerispora sediminis TaxID=1931232 RepID=A0A368TA65_9ACTN|nr:MFS transporter [Marinitenerispora sediminis]RCV52960.1 MFS transporter [Marinitenerispora sediminis]RCV58439.1 MFS transporter [Marinitenerispora sediminis]RCV61781.1 MFS transporter [Marinitenerispora sediminis]
MTTHLPLPEDRAGDPAPWTYRRVLAVGEFRVLLAAEILAVLGLVAAQVTLSVLIYQRTGSPLLSALTFTLGFVPHLLGAVLLSSVTDRFPARGLLVVTQGVSAGLMAAMALPGAPIPVLLGLLAISGAIAPVYQGARAASLPDILAPAGFALGRSLLRMAGQTAQITGFAFGGALLLAVPPGIALLTGAGALALSALLLGAGMRGRPARLAAERSAAAAPAAVLRDSLAGVRDAMAAPLLRTLLLLGWLPPAFAVAAEALAAPLADRLGGGSLTVGLLLAAAPVGIVAGELAVGSLLPPERRQRWTVGLAVLVFAPLPLFALAPAPAAAVALLVVSGLGYGYTLGLDQRLLDAVPEEARGRVLSLASAGLMVVQGLGFAAAGAVAEAVAPQLVVASAGAAGLAVVGWLGAALRRSGRSAPPGGAS